jgi:hypothetical protein
MRRDFERAYKAATGREPRWWGSGIMAWRLYVAGRFDQARASLSPSVPSTDKVLGDWMKEKP